MKLIGSTKSKITEDENGENVPRLDITEVVHCNNVKNDINVPFFLINDLVNYQIFDPKVCTFENLKLRIFIEVWLKIK